MIIIFDIVFFVYGVYTVYAAISMKKNQRLTRFFIAREPYAIRDARGYIDAIYGKAIVMGSMAALFGVLSFVNDYITPILFVMKPLMLLFLTVVIWFGIKLNQAKRKFW